MGGPCDLPLFGAGRAEGEAAAERARVELLADRLYRLTVDEGHR